MKQSLDSLKDGRANKESEKAEKETTLSDAKQENEEFESRLEEFTQEVADKKAERAKEEEELKDLTNAGKSLAQEMKLTEADITELKSGKLIRRHDLEKANRIEHVNITLKNKERSNALIQDKNSDNVLQRFNKDSDIFVADIKEALGIENADVIRDAIQSVREEYDESKKGKKIYDAAQAFKASREALVDINLSKVNDKIHAAIAKGLTSVTLKEDQISGVEILALAELGYKITHKPVSDPPGRLPVELTIIIDWGFAGMDR